MNKNIILAGAIAIGLYLFSQGKAIFSAHSTQTMRQKVAQKRIGHPITRAAYIAALRKAAAQKVAERVPERRPVLPATPMPKKVAQKKVVRTGMALKIYNLKKAIAAAQALRLSTMAPGAVLPPLVAKAIQDRTVKAAIQKRVARKAAARRAAARKTPVHNTIARWVAARKAAVRKAAARRAAARKTPVYSTIVRWVAARKAAARRAAARKTPVYSTIVRWVAARKAAARRAAQKTTHVTPSARRKTRLKALYGSHWHDIWVRRQKRR